MIAATLLLLAALPQQTGRDTLPADTALRLEPVVVSATRTTTVRRETALATTVARPTLRDRAASPVAADLLRDAPGVQVQQTSAGQGAVILRGLVGNQVLLLVNGIPLNNGSYRDGPGQYLATIDPETIERIEVVRGPASVLYGSDAQGGVVNIITRPHAPLPGWSLGAAVHGSSANLGGRARLSLGYDAPRLSFGVGGTLMQAGDLRAGGGLGAQVPTGFTAEGVDARLTLQPAAAHTLTAGIEHFGLRDVPRYDRYVTFRAPAEGPDFRHVFDPQIRQLAFARHGWRPAGAAVHELETTVSLGIQREGRTTQAQDALGNAAPVITGTRDDVTTPGVSVVGTTLLLGATPVRLTWGGEAYRDAVTASGSATALTTGEVTPTVRLTADGAAVPAGRFPDGATMDRVGVFAAADVALARRIRLSGGARWSGFRTRADVGQRFGGAVENRAADVTGQLGAVVTVLDGLDVALRLAEGFRAPNLYDLTNVGTVPGGIVLPNVDARPEQSLSLEAAVRFRRPATAVEVTVYETRIEDFIDRAPGTFQGDTLFNGERVFLGVNVGEATVRGVEAELVHARGPWRLTGTLLYTRGEQTTGGTTEPMAKIPPLSGTARLGWAGRSGTLEVGYHLRWAAAQDRLGSRDLRDPRICPAAAGCAGTPGWVVHGVSGAFRLGPDLRAGAGVENLGNVLYRPHASGVDAAGRHVWVGLSLFQRLGG